MERKQKALFPTPYRDAEQADYIQFRYIYCQCYEIKLPGGTTILTDPFISGGVDDFTVDQVEGADYIILNHTHFDHDMDVGKVWDKFHGRVICQKEVAMETARFFDIPYSSIYAVGEECTYYLPEFTLQTFHGLHDNRKAREGTDKRPSQQGDTTLRRFGIEGHHLLDMMGAVFMMNWVITTKNNFKIAFNAGQDFEEHARHLDSIKPNIMIRHRIRTYSPEDFAGQCARVGAQYILPWHHSNALVTGEDLNQYMNQVNEVLKEMGSTAKAFNPEPYRWYRMYLGIEGEGKGGI
ncbi:MAG: MBL fold metallo-hydrolase [Clostridiaceae bacterium]|nr:MBL fold metallo-hydrolase [Clostridiaceae bacterium]